MVQPAIKQRFERCRVKTLNNLLNVYNVVLPEKEPFHFHCYDKNGHKFVRVEVNDLPEALKENLLEIKKGLPAHTMIQIHYYEKNAKKAKKIDL